MSKESLKRSQSNPAQRKLESNQSQQPPQFKLDATAVQRKVSEAQESATSGPVVKMPENVQAMMERGLGADFSQVRIHPDSEKPATVGAKAFTQGSDIYFNSGQYDPNSKEGKSLLAHELTHTIQQGSGAVNATDQIGGMPVNADKGLEAEADKMAKSVVEGQAADGPGKKKVAGGGSSGPVQRFKMDADDAKRYPKFAAFLTNEIPKCINDARLVKYLNQNGTNSGDTARDIRKDLSPGEGPLVKPWSLPANKVSFLSYVGSETIRLSRGDISGYEKNNDFNSRFHEMALESNLMNGYTQFLDDQDGKDKWGKEGVMTEKAAYGGDINSIGDAKKSTYATFGQGTWQVSVEAASSEKAHRLKVWNSEGNDGNFMVNTGTTMSFTSRKNNNLNFWVESNAGDVKDKKAWDRAAMIKTADGPDNYVVRAEDGQDKDRNDVVVRVRKTS